LSVSIYVMTNNTQVVFFSIFRPNIRSNSSRGNCIALEGLYQVITLIIEELKQISSCSLPRNNFIPRVMSSFNVFFLGLIFTKN
jgi:hypothetical protein